MHAERRVNYRERNVKKMREGSHGVDHRRVEQVLRPVDEDSVEPRVPSVKHERRRVCSVPFTSSSVLPHQATEGRLSKNTGHVSDLLLLHASIVSRCNCYRI